MNSCGCEFYIRCPLEFEVYCTSAKKYMPNVTGKTSPATGLTLFSVWLADGESTGKKQLRLTHYLTVHCAVYMAAKAYKFNER